MCNRFPVPLRLLYTNIVYGRPADCQLRGTNFGQLPIDRVLDEKGEQMVVDVPYLDCLRACLRVESERWTYSLYLLDTDNEMNSEFDRSDHSPAVWR